EVAGDFRVAPDVGQAGDFDPFSGGLLVAPFQVVAVVPDCPVETVVAAVAMIVDVTAAEAADDRMFAVRYLVIKPGAVEQPSAAVVADFGSGGKRREKGGAGADK